MESVLSYVWFFLFLTPLLLFVILDGADLGLGIIALTRTGAERSNLIDAVGPLWYANETWLVIAGATLFGAFPQAYSLVLSSLYIPVMMLVFGLMFRAASTELRGHSQKNDFWGIAFGVGCLLAVLGQGFLLGGLLSDLNIQNGLYEGGAWGWFGLNSVVVALGFVTAYAMLGAAHMLKSQGAEAGAHMRNVLRASTTATLVLSVGAVVFTSMPVDFRAQIYSPPHLPWLISFTAAAIVGFLMLHVTSRTGARCAPYTWAVITFLSVSAVIVSATFPYVVPFSLSVAEAASSRSTLVFMLPGVGAVLLVIIAYNFYVKHVFARKTQEQLKKENSKP